MNINKKINTLLPQIKKSKHYIHQNPEILPLTFDDESDYDKLQANDILIIENVRKIIQNGGDTFTVNVKGKGVTIACKLRASSRQREIMLVGAFSNWVKAKREGTLVKNSST